MKKLFLVAIATVGFAFSGTAQETKFGVKAGVDFASAKVKTPFGDVSSSETGFFVGGFAEIGIQESWSLQPEVLYVSIKDASMISVPVLGKYGVSDSFNLMAGPSFNYNLDWEEDKFKLNVDLGASYDLNEQMDISARYSLGFGDVSLSGLFLGFGYKF